MAASRTTAAAGLARSVPLAAALALALPCVASAQPMDTYGMGSRSVAMGGAVTADVEDGSANYYNPAGLVRDRRFRIDLGWFGAFHELDVNNLDSAVDPVHGAVIGLVVPGNLGDFRFAFGLGVHLNDDRVSRTRSLPRARPRWELFDNRPHRTYLAAHLAIELFDVVRIGGGISFLSYAANRLYVRGDLDIVRADAGSRLEHELRADLTTIRYPQIGIQVQPVPWLSFGATYRGQFSLDNLLTAEVEATLFSGIADPFPGYFFLLTQSVNAFVPQQLSLGGSVSPIPELTINAEVTWVNWSAYISPVGRADVLLRLELPPSLRDLIFVPDSIAGSTPLPANFEDRWVPRLGVEGLAVNDPAAELRVRGGFFYESSPIPEQSMLTNLVDTDRLAFSAGLGLRLDQLRPFLPGFLGFDMHLQYSYLPYRTMRKTSLVDPTGDYVAGGHIFAFGVNVSAGFE